MADEEVIRFTKEQFTAFSILAKQTGEKMEDLVHKALHEYIVKHADFLI